MNADPTSLTSIINGLFSALDSSLFGSVAIMSFFLIMVVFLILMLMNASFFTIAGFMASLLLAFGSYGYAAFGWIGVLGALIFGIALFFIIALIIGEK